MWGTVILFTSLLVLATGVPTCDPSRPAEYLCHETDPTKYYVCSWGHAWLMSCPAGLHFDTASNTCVYAGNGDCSGVADPTGPPDPETVACVAGEVSHHCYPDDPHNGVTCLSDGTKANVSCERAMYYDAYFSNITGDCVGGAASPCDPTTWDDLACPPGHVGLLPHPDKCQFFINCTLDGQVGRMGRPDRPYDECPYPKMFSTNTNQCENFWAVTCNGRPEIKEPCYYRLSGVPIKPPENRRTRRSRHSGGPPCTRWDPSCLNFPDGFNPHPWIPPRYIECLRERTMAVYECPVYGQSWLPALSRCECQQGSEVQPDDSGVLRCVPVNP